MRFCASVAVCVLVSIGSSPATAQQIRVFGQGGGPAASPKKAFEAQINVVIEDIERSCSLSKTQVTRLRVAGKGAVQSALEKHKQQRERMQRAIQQAGGGGVFQLNLNEARDEENNEEEEGDDDETSEDAEQEEVEGPAELLEQVIVGNRMGTGGAKATDEKIWKNAVKSVLTDKQHATYKKVLAERTAYRRKAAVTNFIARADRKLLLSGKQREQLAVIVDKTFGKELGERNQNRNVWVMMQNGQAAAIDYDKLSFLSKSQLAEWKRSVEGELRQLRGVPGLGGGAFQVIGGGNIGVDFVRPGEPDDRKKKKDDDDR